MPESRPRPLPQPVTVPASLHVRARICLDQSVFVDASIDRGPDGFFHIEFDTPQDDVHTISLSLHDAVDAELTSRLPTPAAAPMFEAAAMLEQTGFGQPE